MKYMLIFLFASHAQYIFNRGIIVFIKAFIIGTKHINNFMKILGNIFFHFFNPVWGVLCLCNNVLS